MAKQKSTLRSSFPAAKRAKTQFVATAVDAALKAGEETANQKIERTDAARDYNLPADVDHERIGFQSGKIVYDHFYGRWFEYGTPHIQPMPFMRPAHRKMRKVFIGLMGTEFEGWVKRKAQVRR